MGEHRVRKVDKRRGGEGGQENAIAELRIRDEEDDDDDEEKEEQREGKLMDLIWGDNYLGGGAKTREEY